MLFRIAAVFIGLAMIGSLYFYSNSLNVTVTNDTGNLAQIILPDGSDVTLADNSTIKYNKGITMNEIKNTGAMSEEQRSVINTLKGESRFLLVSAVAGS